MRDGDIHDAIALLSRGFQERQAADWSHALQRLRDRTIPETLPRYGYVLTDGDRLVGIVLVIFSIDDAARARGNVSSWYVEPAYRAFSPILIAAPMRLKDVTLINISPAPETIATIETQGFTRYVHGTFHAAAALSRPVEGATIRRIEADSEGAPTLLRDHAAMGCLSLEVARGGETFPFVFAPNRNFGNRLPSAHLAYCRDIQEFVRFAGPLGRRLLRHGLPSVMLDAVGPIDGLVGLYLEGRRRKFFRGGTRPRLGDLSYSELTLFGFR